MLTTGIAKLKKVGKTQFTLLSFSLDSDIPIEPDASQVVIVQNSSIKDEYEYDLFDDDVSSVSSNVHTM